MKQVKLAVSWTKEIFFVLSWLYFAFHTGLFYVSKINVILFFSPQVVVYMHVFRESAVQS